MESEPTEDGDLDFTDHDRQETTDDDADQIEADDREEVDDGEPEQPDSAEEEDLDLDLDSNDGQDGDESGSEPEEDQTETDEPEEQPSEVETELEEYECPCPEGRCCYNCEFLVGMACADAGWEYQCSPGGVGSCNANYETRQLFQICSGSSPECDGPVVTGSGWVVIDQCKSYEQCTLDGCVEARETCCECQSGPCCDGCRFKNTDSVCRTIEEEQGCPWGNDPGDDIGVRGIYQYCSGGTSECNGNIVEQDWELAWDCWDETHCTHGYCMVNECQVNIDCGMGAPFYCRNGVCEYHEEKCQGGACPDANTYCNTLYTICLPKVGPCRDDADCVGNPAGGACDPAMQKCRGATGCLPEINNCYSGTECRHLDEFLGYKGDYCVNCDNDSECYPGLRCEKRTLYPEVCVP